MSLTAAEVAEIMRLVEQSTFDELTLEMEGVKLSLKRGAAVQANGAALPLGAGFGDAAFAGGSAAGGGAAGAAGAAGTPGRAGATAGHGASAARPGAPAGAATGPAAIHAANPSGTSHSHPPLGANSHDVASPLLGTFYRSPKPGAPPFVEVGATVEEDTVIAIIEVMKLMNTVRAGVRGTVSHIFVSDGSLVEFEQPLIRVSKTG